ncbi:MAG: type IX secretion system membrane protein PorP/SprF [Flavobacteriales bacterium]|nr:type IX secretion system membrane protein PorP/SprF [Flavobacteriales bacterium]
MRSFFFLFFISVLSVHLKSQDVHFSMYDFAPLSLNPAETGLFEGDWRGVVNFREQWKSLGDPFKSVAASYDQNLYFLPGQFSAGFLFVNDQSGNVGLNHNRFLLSLAYKKEGAIWDYSGGLQIGLITKSFGLDGTTFPEQYNNDIGGFDSSLPLSEQNLGTQTSYFDLNLGGLVVRKFATAKVKFGISAHHLNSPDVSFFDNKDKLSSRTNAYVQFDKNFSSSLFVRPMILMSFHNRAQQLLLGGDIGLYTPKSGFVQELWVGLDIRDGFDRNGDAFVASVGFVVNDFRVGLGYDINYSSLQNQTNNKGAIELSLVYTSPSTAIKQITIPCDRY